MLGTASPSSGPGELSTRAWAAVPALPGASLRPKNKRFLASLRKFAKFSKPRTQLLFYRDSDGTVPLLDWLDVVTETARAKCRTRLERLAELGHELRRPEADYLRDGIYELRLKHARTNYRMLYFFHGNRAVVISHGLSKQEARVPPRDIEAAVRRKRAFEADPQSHTYSEDS